MSVVFKPRHMTYVCSSSQHVIYTRTMRDHSFHIIVVYHKDRGDNTYKSISLNRTMKWEPRFKIINGVEVMLPLRINIPTHIFVCVTFCGPSMKIENESVDHINRNHSDNRLENLRWAGGQLQASHTSVKTHLCWVDGCSNVRVAGHGMKCQEHEVLLMLSLGYVNTLTAASM